MNKHLSIKIFYLLIYLITCSFPSIILSQEQPRIISLSPIITEIISELDKESLLVGITDFCKLKNSNLKVKSVGSYLHTSIEGILSLKPDIVILPSEQKDFSTKLAKFNIKFLFVKNKTIDEINNSIIEIGRLVNAEELAKELIKKKTQKLEKILRECNSNSGKRALFIFDEASGKSRIKYYASGSSSFYGELFQKLNLINLLDSKREYVELSLEGIASLKPELLFLVSEKQNVEDQKRILFDNIKILKDIKMLPKDPVVYPGPRYDEIYQLFGCN